MQILNGECPLKYLYTQLIKYWFWKAKVRWISENYKNPQVSNYKTKGAFTIFTITFLEKLFPWFIFSNILGVSNQYLNHKRSNNNWKLNTDKKSPSALPETWLIWQWTLRKVERKKTHSNLHFSQIFHPAITFLANEMFLASHYLISISMVNLNSISPDLTVDASLLSYLLSRRKHLRMQKGRWKNKSDRPHTHTYCLTKPSW